MYGIYLYANVLEVKNVKKNRINNSYGIVDVMYRLLILTSYFCPKYIQITGRINTGTLFFTTKVVLQNEFMSKTWTHTTGHFYIGDAPGV